MKTYCIVLSNPLEGKEKEYNEWYSNVHLKEVVQIPGFISAQRFRLTQEQQLDIQPYKYMAIYEIENENIGTAIRNLNESAGKLTMEPVIDLDHLQISFFRSITEVVK